MPRKARVVTTSLRVYGEMTLTREQNERWARDCLGQAVDERADFVCLPETWALAGIAYERVHDVAEPVPGPTTELAAHYARLGGMYVVCPLMELRGDHVFNTAVMFDRQGRIMGQYDKIHPVLSDEDSELLELGVTPGRDVKVFDTDRGRIGILTCFDINWPAEWAELKGEGAELVFWPSAYEGAFPLRCYAWTHHYYVVSATLVPTAQIIDITGEVLEETGSCSRVAATTIDLEKRFFWGQYAGELREMLRRYGPEVRVHWCQEENAFTLESFREDVTVPDLIAEFGLRESFQDLAFHEAIQNRARAEAEASAIPLPEAKLAGPG